MNVVKLPKVLASCYVIASKNKSTQSTVAVPVYNYQQNLICACGETGRHARFHLRYYIEK